MVNKLKKKCSIDYESVYVRKDDGRSRFLLINEKK